MSDSDKNQLREQASSSEERKRKKRAPPGEFDRQVEAVRKEMQAIKESLEETERRKLEEAERLRQIYGTQSKQNEDLDDSASPTQNLSQQRDTGE
ncbi:hypothetical protein GpartN1_g7354.t1 [Galdieria partita]|uniref:Uncharacterized protein n=1 Tax=Galdieria partita TaxID=83374 RepID=A0A9C7UU57_9RHOD|nr:hypothetical protein GpartN1_g7354.t1 [Galdieria partita]